MYRSNQYFVLWNTSSESSHDVINCVSDNLSFDIYTQQKICFDNKEYTFIVSMLYFEKCLQQL